MLSGLAGPLPHLVGVGHPAEWLSGGRRRRPRSAGTPVVLSASSSVTLASVGTGPRSAGRRRPHLAQRNPLRQPHPHPMSPPFPTPRPHRCDNRPPITAGCHKPAGRVRRSQKLMGGSTGAGRFSAKAVMPSRRSGDAAAVRQARPRWPGPGPARHPSRRAAPAWRHGPRPGSSRRSAGQLQRRFAGAARRYPAIHDAELLGLADWHLPAGQHDVGGAAGASLRSVSWVPPPPGTSPTRHFGQAERRGLVGDDQVAAQTPARSRRRGQTRAPRPRRGCGRSRMASNTPRITVRCAVNSAVGHRGALLQVRAGAERAAIRVRAEHHGPQRSARQRVQRSDGERTGHRGAQRVRRRPVQDDLRDDRGRWCRDRIAVRVMPSMTGRVAPFTALQPYGCERCCRSSRRCSSSTSREQRGVHGLNVRDLGSVIWPCSPADSTTSRPVRAAGPAGPSRTRHR